MVSVRSAAMRRAMIVARMRVMTSIYFKYVLFLGFLVVMNLAVMAVCMFQIANGGGLHYSINGAISLMLAFAHAMLIEDAINDVESCQ